jgi:hypothetical protein
MIPPRKNVVRYWGNDGNNSVMSSGIIFLGEIE